MPLSPASSCLPEVFDLAAQRSDGTKSGYDNAPFHALARQRLGGLSLLDELDRLTDGLNLFGRVVGNVDVELFFEFHHQFDRSSESAPKSLTNDVSGVTFSLSTPSCSATMSITRSSTDATFTASSYKRVPCPTHAGSSAGLSTNVRFRLIELQEDRGNPQDGSRQAGYRFFARTLSG